MVASGAPASFRNPESSGTFVPTWGGCEPFSNSPDSKFPVALSFGESRMDSYPLVQCGWPCSDVSVTLTVGDRWLCEFFLIGCFHALEFFEIGWRWLEC